MSVAGFLLMIWQTNPPRLHDLKKYTGLQLGCVKVCVLSTQRKKKYQHEAQIFVRFFLAAGFTRIVEV